MMMNPLDWEDPRLAAAQREPRRGQRAILAATFATPQGPLLCYNLHMEVFCGMLARIEQFTDVLQDSRSQLRQGVYHQAIMGDLNTMAHGIARLSPNFCNDRMRFWSLGQSEASFWHRNLFLVPDPGFQPSQDGSQANARPLAEQGSDAQELLSSLVPQAALQGSRDAPQSPEDEGCKMNHRLRWWGLPEHVCRAALNPGFSDPWNPDTDITLDNPKAESLSSWYLGLP
ncbi:hypothetical protein WJX84_008730 [Apatococcus fuscideae]|uniref:Endonuclease/exonuclease/phosphatase domain-containing protein n=1 Tax=Apatococcus fuscideae TaxID=2026836 RepID=A0AAW1SGU3_9CHLO